ncbi:MAG TPA: tagatose 1,6-diphosphate aldolase [Anaerolineaceae bacterium]
MRQLTPGKLRGLAATSTSNHVFSVLALDHRQSFARMIDPQAPDQVSYTRIASTKIDFVRELSNMVSAVLLDPIYGAPQCIASGALPGKNGLMIAVEETGYTGDSTGRKSSLLPGWSVAKSKRIGAEAVKLLVYYHPGAGQFATHQEKLVQQVIAECQQEDITLFLEIMVYPIDPRQTRNSPEFTRGLPTLLEEIARRMGSYNPDVLKLEFPVDPAIETDEKRWSAACEAVSAAAGCPWTVLSAGAEFELFCRQVEIACKAGASGFIAGRAVWKDGVRLTGEERLSWLRQTAAPRFARLTSLADLFARPWTDFFPPIDPSQYENWYPHYPA